MSPPVALITGIDGFTGRYVKSELENRGFQVFGISNSISDEKNGVFKVDLLSYEETNRLIDKVSPNVVIHLAAISFVAHGEVSDIYATNVVGTRNLLSSLSVARTPVDSIILASTANLYKSFDSEIITEFTNIEPSNDYGVSKYAMELMANLWIDSLPITIVRPFNYTGVGQSEKFLIPKIVSHFVRGKEKIELGNIDVYRDFSDVRAVASVYAELAVRRLAGDIFNISSGNTHSLKDILSMMAVISGYEICVEVNPAFVRSNEIHKLVGSSEKLHRAIDSSVPTIELNDTLRWMYDTGRKTQS